MLKILKKGYFIHALLVSSFILLPVSAKSQEGEIKQSLPTEEAQQRPAPVEKEDSPEQERRSNAGPKLQELEAYTANLLHGLEPYQAQYIYQIRTEFGVIRSIQVARGDIENAVKSCGEENPDIKEAMQNRFNDWNDVVVPKLSVADVALKEAIQRQGFRPTVRVNMLLDHVQAAFEERDEMFKRVPVTTAEACRSLLESMDKTEESLKTLLEETISSLNNLSTEAPETAAAPVEEIPQEQSQN